MNIIDKLTIEYLADHNYIGDNNKLEGHSKYSLNDLKFYRKRIVNLVKERTLAKSQKKANEIDEIDKILDQFYESCINKFKIEDYHELQQAELSVFNEKKSSDISLDDIHDNTIYNSLEQCNELLYTAREEKKVTLDNFVIKSNGSLVKKPKDYPQLNKINLRDKKLKYKGCSGKNLNNI